MPATVGDNVFRLFEGHRAGSRPAPSGPLRGVGGEGGAELQWSVVRDWRQLVGVETLLARHLALDTSLGKNRHGGLVRAGRCGGAELQWSVVGGQWSEAGDSWWEWRHCWLDTFL